MKKLIIVIFCLFIFPLLTGCYDYKDLSEIIFIDSLGINFKDEKYELTLHIANPSTLTTQEQGSTNVNIKYSLAKSSGNSIFNAFDNIRDYTNLDVTLSLLKSVIISESCLNKNILLEIKDFFEYCPFVYPTFHIYACLDNIDEVFNSINPKDLSPYYSLLGEVISSYKLCPKRYSEFISELLESSLTLIIPIIDFDVDIWYDEKEPINSLTITGIICMDNNYNYNELYVKDFPGLIFLYNFKNKRIMIENTIVNIEDYNYKISYNNNNIKINAILITSILTSTNYVELSKTIKEYYIESMEIITKNKFDLLNVNDFFYRHNINNKFEDIDFEYNVMISAQ